MKTKRIVAAVLLAFVGVSVAYLSVQESTSAPAGQGETGALAESKSALPGEVTSVATAEDAETGHKLIAYYFHRVQRCRKCNTIEAYAKEALEEAYPSALKSGELEWRLVNVEEPAHEHFVEDYQLTSGALVLVDTQDGEAQDWRNLTRVWELVGNELKFKTYVESEAMVYLEPEL
ncbi:MAG: hypothetical protein GY842_00950 [bacterium]|nr:hypothetical protein [bacterium]